MPRTRRSAISPLELTRKSIVALIHQMNPSNEIFDTGSWAWHVHPRMGQALMGLPDPLVELEFTARDYIIARTAFARYKISGKRSRVRKLSWV